MRLHWIVACLLLCSLLSLWAQQDDLDLDRLETPVPTTEPSTPYFGLGGGFVGMFLFPPLDAPNQKVAAWGLPGFSSPLFLSGIEGVVTVGIVPNLRLGFFGVGGSKELQKSFGLDTQRQAELRFSATGISTAYAFVPLRSLTLLPTLAGGWGMISLELVQAPSRTEWENLTPKDVGGTMLQRVSASYLFFHPQLYIEYTPLPFLLVRLGAGYQLSSVGEWKQNRLAVVEGIPKTFRASGPSAQFAIFVGLFN
ncbi:MAG: hypothetical protein NZ960_04610 [Candidatus Kapabacteria bacterium]|nr:hypothetical protein [Candidatus Kapabacteria bacterium]MDW8012070.1 hypothetical protein [Bacteroidota bacterium]